MIEQQSVETANRVDGSPIECGMLTPLPPPRHVDSLLRALIDPLSTRGLDAEGWDFLVRTAGTADLMGTLHGRLERAGVLTPCLRHRCAICGAHMPFICTAHRWRAFFCMDLSTRLQGLHTRSYFSRVPLTWRSNSRSPQGGCSMTSI